MLSSAIKFVSGGVINRTYDVQSSSSFTAGPWKVFNATRKPSKVTAQRATRVSVFVFDKRDLEQRDSSNGRAFKINYDYIYNRLRKEVNLLSKLRHPSVLEIVEPIEENRASLMFVTEYVVGTLRLPELDELEVQKGLMQLAKGLHFLHDSAKLVHSNLVPESVFINQKVSHKLEYIK